MRTETIHKTVSDTVSVTFHPPFRRDDGIQARLDAVKIVQTAPHKPHNTDSLQLAIALSLYNVRHSKDANRSQKKSLETRVRLLAKELIQTETQASQPENFLPTIGIEAEVPIIPMRFYFDKLTLQYADLFDAIGMPRNRSNGDLRGMKSRWEFSPKPSYSAQVQARILSELIQGGFIPHLENSKRPEDIRKHLDENLVSLHINIGKPPRGTPRLPDKDAQLLGKALAIGYTSALRLENRKTKNTPFANTSKSGSLVPLQKAGTWGEGRIELRGMEVLDSKTYRALYAAQASFGLAFKAQAQPNSEYSDYYGNLITDIKTVLEKVNYIPPTPVIDYYADAHEVSRVAGRENVARNMRKVFEKYTKVVRGITSRAINSEGLPLPPEV